MWESGHIFISGSVSVLQPQRRTIWQSIVINVTIKVSILIYSLDITARMGTEQEHMNKNNYWNIICSSKIWIVH